MRTPYDQLMPAVLPRPIIQALFERIHQGQNQFYEIYQRAQRSEEWFTCLYRADESGVLDEAELKSMMEDMTDIEIRQELYCDFTASASNVVIPIDLVTAAAHRLLQEKDVQGSPVILGVDVSRFGDDRTTIFKRQGLWVDVPLVYKGLDNMDTAARVINAINKNKADMTFIDSGAMGAGVIDRIRQLGYSNISEVNFGGKALAEHRYENIRAEMYFKMLEWLKSGGAIPDMPELKSELSIVEYKFSKHGKIILQPKEEIKEKIGKSPDLADGLALTFARPVYPRLKPGDPGYGRKMMCNTDYSIF